MIKRKLKPFLLFFVILCLCSCACLFGWKIHAPGILSESYALHIQPVTKRVALYLPRELHAFTSTSRGGKLADPQVYYVGESLAPMLLEGFQQGFAEFVFMETEPTPQIMRQYAIEYLVAVEIGEFANRVTWKGQGVALHTRVSVFDADMNLLDRFTAKGSSDAQKVFAKKGGPEVNLNAALEQNVLATVQYLQDHMAGQDWGK